jgi:hypothetical protein
MRASCAFVHDRTYDKNCHRKKKQKWNQTIEITCEFILLLTIMIAKHNTKTKEKKMIKKNFFFLFCLAWEKQITYEFYSVYCTTCISDLSGIRAIGPIVMHNWQIPPSTNRVQRDMHRNGLKHEMKSHACLDQVNHQRFFFFFSINIILDDCFYLSTMIGRLKDFFFLFVCFWFC